MPNLPKPVAVEPPAPNAVWLAMSTAPDRACAERIARALVEERLAACVNILPESTSIYRWKGAIEQAGEWPMIIKTTTARLQALQERLAALHPYELPEFVAWQPQRGSPAYFDWVLAETRPAFRRPAKRVTSDATPSPDAPSGANPSP